MGKNLNFNNKELSNKLKDYFKNEIKIAFKTKNRVFKAYLFE
jgi:hypothetical protein